MYSLSMDQAWSFHWFVGFDQGLSEGLGKPRSTRGAIGGPFYSRPHMLGHTRPVLK